MISAHIVPPRQPNPDGSHGPMPVHPIETLQKLVPEETYEWLMPEEERQETREQTAGGLMETEVMTVELRTPVQDLVELLTRRRISGAPVLNAKGVPCGVVSLTDVVTHLGRNPHDPRLAETPVGQVMSPFFYYATENATLAEMTRVMLKHHIHRLLIVRGDEIVGIVTSLDLLRAWGG